MRFILAFSFLFLFLQPALAEEANPAQTMPFQAPPDPCKNRAGNITSDRCGWAYERGDGRQRDYKKALQMYRATAEKGDPVGQDLLGRLYRDGRGVPKNCTEAAKWFRKAADQRSNDGKADLGILYAEGCKDFKPNFEEAFFWLTLPRWHHLGDFMGLNDGRMKNLGYDFNTPCIEDALDEARRHLTPGQISSVGLRVEEWKPPPSPVDDMGDCFANGNGVLREGSDMVNWCFNAAKIGNERAMENLGSIYNSGNVAGIKQDFGEAYFWWSVAIYEAGPERRDYAQRVLLSVRDAAEKKLTSEQKMALDKRVADWVKDHPAPVPKP